MRDLRTEGIFEGDDFGEAGSLEFSFDFAARFFPKLVGGAAAKISAFLEAKEASSEPFPPVDRFADFEQRDLGRRSLEPVAAFVPPFGGDDSRVAQFLEKLGQVRGRDAGFFGDIFDQTRVLRIFIEAGECLNRIADTLGKREHDR